GVGPSRCGRPPTLPPPPPVPRATREAPRPGARAPRRPLLPPARRTPSGTLRTTRGGARPHAGRRPAAGRARTRPGTPGPRRRSFRPPFGDPGFLEGLLVLGLAQLDQRRPQPGLHRAQGDAVRLRDLPGGPAVEVRQREQLALGGR